MEQMSRAIELAIAAVQNCSHVGSVCRTICCTAVTLPKTCLPLVAIVPQGSPAAIILRHEGIGSQVLFRKMRRATGEPG